MRGDKESTILTFSFPNPYVSGVSLIDLLGSIQTVARKRRCIFRSHSARKIFWAIYINLDTVLEDFTNLDTVLEDSATRNALSDFFKRH